MNCVSYRRATAADLPAICELGESVNAVHHEAFPHIFAGPGTPDRDAMHWAASLGSAPLELGRDEACIVVAEFEGRVLGFVSVAMANESHSLLQPLRFGRIGSASVSKTWQGQGVGRGLMREAHAWVRTRGGQEVRLVVWAFNEGARRLYQDLGYEVRSLNLACSLEDGEA